MEELFSIVGKLYYDLVRSQTIIEGLQKQVEALKEALESNTHANATDRQ